MVELKLIVAKHIDVRNAVIVNAIRAIKKHILSGEKHEKESSTNKS